MNRRRRFLIEPPGAPLPEGPSSWLIVVECWEQGDRIVSVPRVVPRVPQRRPSTATLRGILLATLSALDDDNGGDAPDAPA